MITRTGPPFLPADIAELRAAAAGHVRAGLAVLDQHGAFEAPLPAALLGYLGEQLEVFILRAGLIVPVGRGLSAEDAKGVVLGAARRLGHFVVALDPEGAARVGAVNPVGGGDGVFG